MYYERFRLVSWFGFTANHSTPKLSEVHSTSSWALSSVGTLRHSKDARLFLTGMCDKTCVHTRGIKDLGTIERV